MPTIPPQHLGSFFPFVLSDFTYVYSVIYWLAQWLSRVGLRLRVASSILGVAPLVSEPFIGLRRASLSDPRVSHRWCESPASCHFCLRYPARHGQHFYGAITKYYPPVHHFAYSRSWYSGLVLQGVLGHCPQAFPRWIPTESSVRAGGFHRACWAGRRAMRRFPPP